MEFFNRIERRIFSSLNLTPNTFRKGEKFEQLVRDIPFPKEYYELLHKSHKYNQNKKDFVEDSLLPDYKFRCEDTKKEFWVECKYRNKLMFDKGIDKMLYR